MKEIIFKYMKEHGFGEFNPKAVLFDMDGVLYNSMPNHAVAWQESMKQFDIHMTAADAYATDTCYNNHLTLFAQSIGNSLNLIEELRSDRRWQMQPSQEIVTFTSAVLKSFLSGLNLRLVSLYCTFCKE
jgi:phosphoglycolate phosphatase-like HAD superfamily hydrolase